MSPKILALIAMALVLSVGGAVFVYGSLGGTADTSSDGTNATSAADEDDNEDDDSGTWKDSGVDVVVDAASGLTLTYVSGTEQCYTDLVLGMLTTQTFHQRTALLKLSE